MIFQQAMFIWTCTFELLNFTNFIFRITLPNLYWCVRRYLVHLKTSISNENLEVVHVSFRKYHHSYHHSQHWSCCWLRLCPGKHVLFPQQNCKIFILRNICLLEITLSSAFLGHRRGVSAASNKFLSWLCLVRNDRNINVKEQDILSSWVGLFATEVSEKDAPKATNWGENINMHLVNWRTYKNKWYCK